MTLGAMYPLEIDDDPACEICGSSQIWEPCEMCGGEGRIEVYESDPMWYDPGDTERCELCEGKGGWYLCLNRKSHPD